MSTCLITEVKQQWATLLLGWVTRLSALLVFLIVWRLALVDRTPFWPCFFFSKYLATFHYHYYLSILQIFSQIYHSMSETGESTCGISGTTSL